MAERTMGEALVLLGLERPRVTGKTQEEVDAKLKDWKESSLKKAYKEKVHETHPDKHPDDADAGAKFQAVKEAYDQLVELRVNLKKPVVACPQGHERIPLTAKFCYECGFSYDEDQLLARLKKAGIVPGTIEVIRANGELDKLRALDPFSNTLVERIQLLYHRQRLGLIGPFSGWPSTGK